MSLIASAVAVIAALVVGGSTLAGGTAQPVVERRLDASTPIPFFVADGTGRAGYRASDGELAAWALEDWRRHAGDDLRFVRAPEAAALVRIYWADARDGQYGEMRPLTLGGRRGAAVYIRPDTRALGRDIDGLAQQDDLFRDTIVYLTCVHELGHALGLEHTADWRDIMYFFGFGGDIVDYFARYRRQLESRSDIPRVTGLSGGDVERIRSLYAGR